MWEDRKTQLEIAAGSMSRRQAKLNEGGDMNSATAREDRRDLMTQSSPFRDTVELCHDLRRAGWIRAERRGEARRWVWRGGCEAFVYPTARRYVADDPRSVGQVSFYERGQIVGWYSARAAP